MKKEMIAGVVAMLFCVSGAVAQTPPDTQDNEAWQDEAAGPDRPMGHEGMHMGGPKGGMMGEEGRQGMGPKGGMMGKGMMGGGRPGKGMMDDAEVMAVIKKHDPQFADKLAKLKTAAPGKCMMMQRMAGRMFSMAKIDGDEALEKDIVRGLSLEYDVRELAKKYEQEKDNAKTKAELKAKLSELFDLRLKGQTLRLAKMEKDLVKLKSRLESRKANKAKIVDQRLEQITGEDFSW